jgi:hypothetical protein
MGIELCYDDGVRVNYRKEGEQFTFNAIGAFLVLYYSNYIKLIDNVLKSLKKVTYVFNQGKHTLTAYGNCEEVILTKTSEDSTFCGAKILLKQSIIHTLTSRRKGMLRMIGMYMVKYCIVVLIVIDIYII